LFCQDQLITTIRDRDPELIFAILALALRFSDHPLSRDSLEQHTLDYADIARTMVMRRVSEGPVELSTLQSLCLLSLVDFTSKCLFIFDQLKADAVVRWKQA
jgi:hypothetical protein